MYLISECWGTNHPITFAKDIDECRAFAEKWAPLQGTKDEDSDLLGLVAYELPDVDEWSIEHGGGWGKIEPKEIRLSQWGGTSYIVIV